jgi:diaminopimelate decarboxylase
MKTPYLKFYKEKLLENYSLFEKTCQKHFNNKFKICFSTKTNTNPLTIKTLKKTSCGFEVASLRETKLTPKNSFRVMNGPAKTPKEIKYAIKNNILIFIDSFSEFEKIKLLTTNHQLPTARLGLRLGNKNSKFGFSTNQLKEAIKKINPIAIQLHQGTLKKFKDFQKNLEDQYKILEPYLNKIKYINFGGGYPDNFQLKNLQLTLNDYLQKIKQTFKDFKGTFIFEPGRNLVADTYTLITKVITIKEKDEINYAILNAGINILSKITLAQFKFNKITFPNSKHPIPNTEQKSQTFILAGPLLFNNDIIKKWHGKLQEGDLFEVENIGAYCENLSWNIIYDIPKVI